MTREKVVAAALLVSVFMAGALSALAVERVLEAGRAPTVAPGPGFGRPGGPPGRFGPEGRLPRGGPLGLAPVLEQRLGLSADQRAAIEAILERHRAGSDSVLVSVRPALQAQLDSARGAIRAVLSDGQRAAFDRFTEEGRGMMMRRLQRTPGR